MSDKVTQIRGIIVDMQKSNDAYYAGAKTIWGLLSLEEQGWLKHVFERKPLWKGEVKDDTDVQALLAYGLFTWANYQGEEGYITGTFAGYATVKSQSK